MKARIRLDGETPRDFATSSTRSSSAAGRRIETIWRIVSGAGSCGGGGTAASSSKTLSCSPDGAPFLFIGRIVVMPSYLRPHSTVRQRETPPRRQPGPARRVVRCGEVDDHGQELAVAAGPGERRFDQSDRPEP